MAAEIFNELEATKVKELFDAFDTDHDGLIRAPELIHLCAQFGHELSADKAAEVIAKNDPAGTGSVDWERFCKALAVVLVKIKGAIVMVSLFRAMDTDKTGVITEANINQLVAQAGAHCSETRVHELFTKIDTQGKGEVNFKEFIVALVAHLRTHH